MNWAIGVISGALAVMNSPSGLTGIKGLNSLVALTGIGGIGFLGAGACLAENLALTVAFTMPGYGFDY
jgi:hypothetical protein